MADEWDAILAHKDFRNLSLKNQVEVAKNYFKENIESHQDYQSLEQKDRISVRSNFFKTLQKKAPSNLEQTATALYQTAKNVPRTIMSGATLGLSERVGEAGIKLAGKLTGTDTTQRVSEYKKEYGYIPPMSKTIGEFAGAALPISKIGAGIGIGIKTLTPKLGSIGAQKMFAPIAKAVSWAIAGTGYGAVEKGIKKGELPTAKELGNDAAMWGGTEAIINSLGWGGRMAMATNSLAKAYGISRKEALTAIFKQAKETGEPIVNIASQKEAAQKALSDISESYTKRDNVIKEAERNVSLGMDSSKRQIDKQYSIDIKSAIDRFNEVKNKLISDASETGKYNKYGFEEAQKLLQQEMREAKKRQEFEHKNIEKQAEEYISGIKNKANEHPPEIKIISNHADNFVKKVESLVKAQRTKGDKGYKALIIDLQAPVEREKQAEMSTGYEASGEVTSAEQGQIKQQAEQSIAKQQESYESAEAERVGNDYDATIEQVKNSSISEEKKKVIIEKLKVDKANKVTNKKVTAVNSYETMTDSIQRKKQLKEASDKAKWMAKNKVTLKKIETLVEELNIPKTYIERYSEAIQVAKETAKPYENAQKVLDGIVKDLEGKKKSIQGEVTSIPKEKKVKEKKKVNAEDIEKQTDTDMTRMHQDMNNLFKELKIPKDKQAAYEDRISGIKDKNEEWNVLDDILDELGKQKKKIGKPSAGQPTEFLSVNPIGAVTGITGDEDEPYDPLMGAMGVGASLLFKGRKTKHYADAKPNPTSSEKVAGMYQRSKDALAEKKSFNTNKIKDALVRALIDVSGKAKEMAKSVDAKIGREVEMKKNAIAGAPAEASRQFEDTQAKIFKGLSKNEEDLLNAIVNARRNIEVSSYRPNVVHQEGLTSKDFSIFLDDIKSGRDTQGVDKKRIPELMKRSDLVFDSYKDDLRQMFDAGTLDKENFDALNEHIYSPRQFLQHLDGLDKKITGRSLSSGQSGIKALDEGSLALMETSSRELIHQSKIRTQDIIARNNANLALLKLADFKDNPVVRRASIAKSTQDGRLIYESAGHGEERISVLENGKRVEMIVPRELAKSWVKSDPLINHALAQGIQWVTGTKILKMVATGYNPAFALTNMSRDIGLVWTGGQYSRTLPVAAGQFMKDFADTAKDAITRKGRAIDYVKEGGGTELLTYYGQGNHIAPLNAAEKVLGYIGSTSEIWTRLAHRERALKNLSKKFKEENGRLPSPEETKELNTEATQIAREGGVDFSQGGNVIKALDNFIPYLNANVQGTRLLFNNAKKNKAAFAYQMSQLGTLGASLYWWNKNADPEALKQISDQDKSANFIFILPDIMPGVTSYIDDKGQKRNRFIKIAKEQSQRIFIAPFEAAAEFYDTGKIPLKKIFMDIEALVLPYKVPILSAMTAIAGNVDDYQWQQIWNGARNIKPEEEWRKDTPKAFVKAGELAGLSPVRIQAAIGKILPPSNPLIGSAGSVTQMASGELSEELKRKGWNQFISENRGLRRIISSTSPSNEYSSKVQEEIVSADTESFKQNRQLDILADKYFKSENPDDYNKLAQYVNSQEGKTKDKLVKRYQDAFELKDYPDRDFWKIMKSAPVKARAAILFDRMLNATPEEEKTIAKTAKEIKGILTDSMLEEYVKLVNKHNSEKRK